MFLICSFFYSFSQKESGWKQVDKSAFDDVKEIRKSSLPSDYKLFEFDYQKLKLNLKNVPNRENFSGISNVIVSLPKPDGNLELLLKLVCFATYDYECPCVYIKGGTR